MFRPPVYTVQARLEKILVGGALGMRGEEGEGLRRMA